MGGVAGLAVGALVSWPAVPGAPVGVVTELDGSRIQIRFDGDPEPKTFSAHAGAVERVALGGLVRRVSTGTVGHLQAQTTSRRPCLARPPPGPITRSRRLRERCPPDSGSPHDRRALVAAHLRLPLRR